VESGPTDIVFSTAVDSGSFSASAPSAGAAFTLLQYDGPDQTSTLNPSGALGLSNNDFTANGANAIHLRVSSDHATTVEVFIYSGSSTDFCSNSFQVAGTAQFGDYVQTYSKFSVTGAGCDFANVGAVEVTTDLPQNVDLAIDIFATTSSGAASASRTPSHAVAASHSRTRTPSHAAAASNSRTRTPSHAVAASHSRTPSPHVATSHSSSHRPNNCNCICPAKHCVLVADPSGYDTYFNVAIVHSYAGGPVRGIKEVDNRPYEDYDEYPIIPAKTSSASLFGFCFALVALIVLLN